MTSAAPARESFLTWLKGPQHPVTPVPPEEVIYSADTRPPMGTLLVVAVQHVLLVLMLSIYAVIAARSSGLDQQNTILYTSTAMFMFGLMSLMQGLKSRFTPGAQLLAIPSPVIVATYVSIIAIWGPGAAVGAVIVSNLMIMLMIPLLPRLRGFVPPEVVGTAVLMLGITLIPGAAEQSLGLDEANKISLDALSISVATLFGIVVAAVAGGTRVRIMSLIIGAGFGTVVAFVLGAMETDFAAQISDLPLVANPVLSPLAAWPVFVPTAIFGLFVIELIHAMDQMASAMTIEKLNNKNWIRPDMSLVSKSVFATAVANVLCGAAGILTGGSSTANIGLANASGVMSRHIAIVAGLILIAIAFIPAFATLIVLTPDAVVGGILIYTAAFMIVAGMQLILSRMMDTRRSFTVGLSIVIGTTIIILPSIADNFPQWSQTIVGSGMSVAAVSAVLLNAVFRIGLGRTVELSIPQTGASAAVADFLEKNGKIWGARRDVIVRGGIAVGEALELLSTMNAVQGPVGLEVNFDEVNLRCTLRYEGTALKFGRPKTIDLEALLDDDDEESLDIGMQQMSSALVARLADRVSATAKGSEAKLLLEFHH